MAPPHAPPHLLEVRLREGKKKKALKEGATVDTDCLPGITAGIRSLLASVIYFPLVTGGTSALPRFKKKKKKNQDGKGQHQKLRQSVYQFAVALDCSAVFYYQLFTIVPFGEACGGNCNAGSVSATRCLLNLIAL